MGLVETEAIVLSTYRLAEADKIVVCLTEQSGLIRGVARGARRLKNRFGAGLEPFTVVQLSYYEKEGRELVSVRGTEIVRSYFSLAKDAETNAALGYLGALAIEFAPPHEPNEKLFRLVRACLEALTKEASGGVTRVVRYFELWTLKLSGFLPDFDCCAGCGRQFATIGGEAAAAAARRRGVYLSAESSLRCAECAGKFDLSVSDEAHARFCAAQRVGPAVWARGGLRIELEAELAQFTRRLIVRALERHPRGAQLLQLTPAPHSPMV